MKHRLCCLVNKVIECTVCDGSICLDCTHHCGICGGTVCPLHLKTVQIAPKKGFNPNKDKHCDNCRKG